jgi:hypothetical protein
MWTDWWRVKGRPSHPTAWKNCPTAVCSTVEPRLCGHTCVRAEGLLGKSIQRWGSGPTTVQIAVNTLGPLNRRPYNFEMGYKGFVLAVLRYENPRRSRGHRATLHRVSEEIFSEARRLRILGNSRRRRAGAPKDPGPGESWPHPTRRHSSSAYNKLCRNSANPPLQNPPAPNLPPPRRAARGA